MFNKFNDPRLPKLPDSLLMLCEVGSTAHGTGIPGGEDLDQMGVYIEDIDKILGIMPSQKNVMQRTQPEGIRSGPGDIDRTLLPLRNYISLTAAGNPSLIMTLWSPKYYTNPNFSDRILSNDSLFVGRHIIDRYQGYMNGQAMKLLGLKGHSGRGKRGSGQRTELIEKYGYDTKYAMHCSRLGMQCKEILTTGRLAIPMTNTNGDWLRNLRQGGVPFKEWFDYTLDLYYELDTFRGDTNIPENADLTKISEMCREVYLEYYY